MSEVEINVPEPQVMVVQKDGKQIQAMVQFKEFMLATWCLDRRWGENLLTLDCVNELKQKAAASNGKMTLLSNEHQALSKVVRAPDVPYNPQNSEATLVFARAVLNAKPVIADVVTCEPEAEPKE